MAVVRLALVEDHQLFRDALGDVLRSRGFDLVAAAGDARTAFQLIDRTHPDLVLLDLELPGLDGVTAMREMMARPAAPKVMILSAHSSRHHVADAWAAGAHGYALKSIPVDDLVDGIGRVMAGERYLSPGL